MTVKLYEMKPVPLAVAEYTGLSVVRLNVAAATACFESESVALPSSVVVAGIKLRPEAVSTYEPGASESPRISLTSLTCKNVCDAPGFSSALSVAVKHGALLSSALSHAGFAAPAAYARSESGPR